MLAVLEQALRDYRTHLHAVSSRGREAFARVQAWFLADDTDVPYSFASICDVLELEPTSVRARLPGPRRRALASRAADPRTASTRKTAAMRSFDLQAGGGQRA